MKKHIVFFLFSILFSAFSFSQPKKVELLHANSLEFDEKLGKDVKRLLGNVSFKHADALLYCDSAYLYPNNSIDAFNNVRIHQGDSVTIYGQFLKYNGNTRMAELQKNVRFIQKGTTLNTELLYYDMKTSVANYPGGGTIVSKQNTLTSQLGYFNTKKSFYSFKKNVTLVNPQYVMYCDTLNYYSGNNTAYFSGPTRIKSTENFIYCESGWYNTDNDIAQFSENAYIITGRQKMKGDSIFFDKLKDIGKAFGNVSLIDSAENIIVTGDYAVRHGKAETSTITGHALLKQYSDSDTLYLHADTLRVVDEHPIKKVSGSSPHSPLPAPNSDKDTSVTWRVMYAYRKVKFFRTDIQGKCDSLVYSGSDSIMRMYKAPVLWSEQNQLTAEKVELKTSGGEITTMFLKKMAFIISKEDSLKYNQIKGKQMTGYFNDNKLEKIFVEGNGQTIYFTKDKEKLIGINKANSSNMMIFVKENKVQKITLLKKPDATLFPVKDFTPKEFILKDFIWRENERPLSMQDIFR